MSDDFEAVPAATKGTPAETNLAPRAGKKWKEDNQPMMKASAVRHDYRQYGIVFFGSRRG
jgi:hypothetical protein